MNYVIFLTSLLFCFTLVANSSEAIYKMGDLRVLSAEQNYPEFFKHALDIRPAERNKEWKSMVESMGQSYLEELLTLTKIDQATFGQVRKLSKWPIFKNNEFFIKKRDMIFLKEIASCGMELKNIDCMELASSIYNDFTHELTFDYDFILAINKLGATRATKWAHIKDFITKDLSEFYCHRPVLKDTIRDQAVWELETNGKIDFKMHPDCLKVLAQELRKDLLATKPSVKQSAYLMLKKGKLLTSKDEQIYYLLEFIDSKSLSEEMLDLALENLKNLSKDYKSRDEILRKYQQIDPLPDNIFGSNQTTDITRVKILARYFPEVIDMYARTCLEYLDGEKTFPFGNPTPNCHEFFKTTKIHDFVPKSFVKRYDRATYFVRK